MSLKAYEGDVSDLGLDFTVVCDELGETRVIIFDLRFNFVY
jgi:ubiquitin-protein ligase E3 C